MKNLSIVLPTRNERNNIVPLVERIHTSLTSINVNYELIFIDDHSTDGTQEIITTLSQTYPISLYEKKGKLGKANSLIEGFSYTHYDVICIIDADLQYPPEAIPEMLAKIYSGADIVVANRKDQQTNFVRKLFSEIYRLYFVRFLHGINLDSQSGLKIFKKEIIVAKPK